MLRVPHAENFRPQAKRLHWLDQKLTQFGSALVIAPVTDPDDIALEMTVARHAKHIRVRRFVPRPRAPGPAAFLVNLAQQIAVGENAIVMREIVLTHLLRRGDSAVVSVMEKKVICAAGLGPVLADAPYKRGVVPLMNQNEIGALECAIEIKCADVVRFRS